MARGDELVGGRDDGHQVTGLLVLAHKRGGRRQQLRLHHLGHELRLCGLLLGAVAGVRQALVVKAMYWSMSSVPARYCW